MVRFIYFILLLAMISFGCRTSDVETQSFGGGGYNPGGGSGTIVDTSQYLFDITQSGDTLNFISADSTYKVVSKPTYRELIFMQTFSVNDLADSSMTVPSTGSATSFYSTPGQDTLFGTTDFRTWDSTYVMPNYRQKAWTVRHDVAYDSIRITGILLNESTSNADTSVLVAYMVSDSAGVEKQAEDEASFRAMTIQYFDLGTWHLAHEVSMIAPATVAGQHSWISLVSGEDSNSSDYKITVKAYGYRKLE